MRITTNMIASQQMTGLQTNMAAVLQAQEEVTTGLTFNSASENPTAATQVMSVNTSLRALEQYRTNVSRASSATNEEDSVLSQLGDLMTRAKELGVAEATDTASADSRTTTNAEVQQIFQQIAQLGNTQLNGQYLFGGQQNTTAPFSTSGAGATIDYASDNPTGQQQISIGDNQTVAPTHDGKQIFLDTGVLDSVKQLSQALDPTSSTYGQAGISAALTSIDSAYSAVQSLVGDTGAVENRLSSANQNLTALSTNLTSHKSDLEDVDMETAMTELTSRQNAYQAALLATSKVTGMDLTQYLATA